MALIKKCCLDTNQNLFTGKTAILSSISKFMSVNPEDDSVVAQSSTADEHEFCSIRSNKTREENKVVLPAEEEGDLAEVEVNYV